MLDCNFNKNFNKIQFKNKLEFFSLEKIQKITEDSSYIVYLRKTPIKEILNKLLTEEKASPTNQNKKLDSSQEIQNFSQTQPNSNIFGKQTTVLLENCYYKIEFSNNNNAIVLKNLSLQNLLNISLNVAPPQRNRRKKSKKYQQTQNKRFFIFLRRKKLKISEDFPQNFSTKFKNYRHENVKIVEKKSAIIRDYRPFGIFPKVASVVAFGKNLVDFPYGKGQIIKSTKNSFFISGKVGKVKFLVNDFEITEIVKKASAFYVELVISKSSYEKQLNNQPPNLKEKQYEQLPLTLSLKQQKPTPRENADFGKIGVSDVCVGSILKQQTNGGNRPALEPTHYPQSPRPQANCVAGSDVGSENQPTNSHREANEVSGTVGGRLASNKKTNSVSRERKIFLKNCLDYKLEKQLFEDFKTFECINDVVNKPVLNIGFDCEWRNLEKPRENGTWRDILSYQFSFCFGSYFYEFVFVVNEDFNNDFSRLTCNDAISVILNHLSTEYAFLTGFSLKYTKYEADLFLNGCYKGNFKYFGNFERYESDKITLKKFNKRVAEKGCISINLISHFGVGDLSIFGDFPLFWNKLTIINKCPTTQGKHSKAIKFLAKYIDINKHNRAYYIKMNVRDTGLQAAPGSKALSILGDAIHYPKLDVGIYRNENKMYDLMKEDFDLFLRYAATDASISCLYANLIFGFNKLFPPTITSLSATIAKNKISYYLGCSDLKMDFNLKYRGLVEDTSIFYEDLPEFLTGDCLVPYSSDVNIIQQFCSNAYFGGFNMSSRIGFYDTEKTFDYDLQNAYPTAMCLIPDVDWENPIKKEIRNKYIKKGELKPTTPFVCACRFEFPKNVKFPCIPIKSSGCLIYPLESSGAVSCRYTAAPFVYLALELGAKVFVERGFYLRTLPKNKSLDCLGGSISYAVKELINDRNLAKKLYGKKSLQELILKVCVNSTYGKTAQNVSLKKTYDAYEDEMDTIGASSITNPFVACMTTSLVQCFLLAACNEIERKGYKVYSATTDGFISNAPYELVEKLDLYGFKKYLSKSRVFLTKDKTAWEVKHYQDALLNFSTRGNVGLNNNEKDTNAGVLAHCGIINKGLKKDSIEDRKQTFSVVVKRKGSITCLNDDWLPSKMISKGVRKKELIDFHVANDTQRKISADFDLKRNIDFDNLNIKFVYLDNEKQNYEICNFNTKPYLNENEFLKIKNIKRKFYKNKCLKTKQQILDFYKFISNYNNENTKQKSSKEILKICISGYRKNLWKIKFLDNFKKAKDKIDAINIFINTILKEDFKYTLNDFYNSIKHQAIKIDTEKSNLYEPLLTKLQAFNL